MERRVTFANARGETLSGVVHGLDHAASSRGVVLCHGMESSKCSPKILTMSRFLCQKGLTTLRFDFAGSGASAGNFAEITYSRQVDDLRAAVAYLANSGVTRIGLIGSSMGGSVALLYAGSARGLVPVAGVATIAAPSDPLEMVRQFASMGRLNAWEERGVTEYHGRRLNRTLLDDMRTLDIIGAAKRIACPVLLIHGDADRTVSVDQAYWLYEALETEKRLLILHGADHRLSEPKYMTTAVDAAQDWMMRHVGSP